MLVLCDTGSQRLLSAVLVISPLKICARFHCHLFHFLPLRRVRLACLRVRLLWAIAQKPGRPLQAQAELLRRQMV